jgi:hypothetical protein
LEQRPNCAAELKLIGAILKTPVIKPFLAHPALQALSPPRALARGRALQAA